MARRPSQASHKSSSRSRSKKRGKQVEARDLSGIPFEFDSPDSSSIVHGYYDASTETLTVTFKDGKRYRYSKFLLAYWVEFYQADSKGKHFMSRIRPFYIGEPV